MNRRIVYVILICIALTVSLCLEYHFDRLTMRYNAEMECIIHTTAQEKTEAALKKAIVTRVAAEAERDKWKKDYRAAKNKVGALEKSLEKSITLIEKYRASIRELERKLRGWQACFQAMLQHAQELRRLLNEARENARPSTWLKIVYPVDGQVITGPVPVSWTWGNGVPEVSISYARDGGPYVPVSQVDCYKVKGFFEFQPPGPGEYRVKVAGDRCGSFVTFKVK